MNLSDELNKCSNYSCIFKLVKRGVKDSIGKRRVGLSLGLTDLPNHVGAFHQVGSNFIVMNKNLLKEIRKSNNKKLINAYIFHVLLHEYLHSLGYINEQEVRILSHEISKNTIGSEHPATLIARYGIGSVFSNMKLVQVNRPKKLGEIEIVDNFENENLSYIG